LTPQKFKTSEIYLETFDAGNIQFIEQKVAI